MRARIWAAAAAALLAASQARGQMLDPLTGGTLDANAALGSTGGSGGAVYFDRDGRVVSDASQADSVSFTEGGTSSLPRKLSELGPEDRRKLGLDGAPEASCSPGTPGCALYGPPAPGPGPGPERDAKPGAPDPQPEPSPDWMVPGSETKDPVTGIDVGTILPELADAARRSYGKDSPSGAANAGPAPSVEAPGRRSGGASRASGEGPQYIAQAAAAQARALEGGSSWAYRTLGALIALRDELAQALDGDGAPSAVYEGAPGAGSHDDTRRFADARFGLAQQTSR